MRRMSNRVRSERWVEKATQFIAEITAVHSDGYIFLAMREVSTKHWKERVFEVGNHEQAIFDHFKKYTRSKYDHYYCPNVFNEPKRIATNVTSSNRAWVDIDNADPEKFDPLPNVLVETSPGRYQGLWFFKDIIDRNEAELYSKALAYNFGADKSGWSVTKYLRVPYTFNHKEEYDRPSVKLLKFDPTRQKRKAIPVTDQIWRSSNSPIAHAELKISKKWRKIHDKYRRKLHPRVRALIGSERAYAFEQDRSKCIFEIVAGLAEVGAKPQEIASVLWHNPFFLSKHGQDIGALNDELRRILVRIGVAYDF